MAACPATWPSLRSVTWRIGRHDDCRALWPRRTPEPRGHEPTWQPIGLPPSGHGAVAITTPGDRGHVHPRRPRPRGRVQTGAVAAGCHRGELPGAVLGTQGCPVVLRVVCRGPPPGVAELDRRHRPGRAHQVGHPPVRGQLLVGPQPGAAVSLASRSSTADSSTKTMPAPPIANLARWVRCQSVRQPSTALYWHIGEATIRLRAVTPPTAER